MLKSTYILLFFACLTFTANLSAQDKREKQLTKIELAERALKSGNLKQAINYVDELFAVGDIDPSLINRTHYLRGRVYHDQIFSPNAKRVLSHIQIASESFQEVQADNSDKNKYKELAAIRHENLWGQLINKGIEAYSATKSVEATFYFMGAQKVKPTDTLGYLYAGVVATQLKDWALVYENFNKLLELNHHTEDVYSTLAYVEESINLDLNKALNYTRNGIRYNPQSNALILNEINLLLKLDKKDEAKSRIKTVLKDNSNNVSLNYDLGYLYEKSGDSKRAIRYYEKALAINGEHEKSLYNLAVIRYNKAVEQYKMISALSPDKRKSKGRKMEAKADQLMNSALIHFEKLNKMNKDDQVVIKALYKIYSKLGMTDKLDELAPYVE